MNKYQRQLDRLCRRSNNPVPAPKPLTGIEKELIEEQNEIEDLETLYNRSGAMTGREIL
jgi:hypothetical protein